MPPGSRGPSRGPRCWAQRWEPSPRWSWRPCATAAVTVLAVIVGTMYLVSYLVPIFGWPEWLNRLSVFWAFGHPYLAWPHSGTVVLLAMALVGGAAATAIAERTPKVA